MPEIHFTLRVANRKAMAVPDARGYVDPWTRTATTVVVPRHDDWVWIAAPGRTDEFMLARSGHAVHVPGDGDIHEPHVTIPLLLATLSPESAAAIGVKHEDWMIG